MIQTHKGFNASALVFAGLMSTTGLLCASSALAQNSDASAKLLEVQKATDADSEQQAFAFAVQLEKTEFETGEPVSFYVEGSQEFYLYVFSEDLETGEKTMLLPNARQAYNAFPANSAFAVPDATVRFTRENPGTELITAVATTEFVAIDSDNLLDKGVFFEGGKELLSESAKSKGIVINDAGETDDDNANVRVYQTELTFIAAEPVELYLLPDDEDAPAVMTTTSCAVCEAGKVMKIGFAADQDGILTLLVVEPDGGQTTLLSERVVANEIQYVSAVAQAPLGEHSLIALFGAEDDELKNVIANVLPVKDLPNSVEKQASDSEDQNDKAIVLVREPDTLLPHAIRQFVVVE